MKVKIKNKTLKVGRYKITSRDDLAKIVQLMGKENLCSHLPSFKCIVIISEEMTTYTGKIK